ncbi:MAG: hypothetical protein FJ290_19110 [Planctomycetes bacterium]|nr:hypothetical protein [Planctomycetota bacterium]
MKVICLMLAAATLNPGGVWGEEASKPDLGSPKSAVLAFKAAVLRRDWVTAEKCLATDVRKILTDAIADRTFFDQYVVNGFTAKTLGFLPANLVTQEGLAQLERLARPAELGGPPGPLPRRYVVTIAQGGGACPWIARCVLVNEGDGWKLSTEP